MAVKRKKSKVLTPKETLPTQQIEVPVINLKHPWPFWLILLLSFFGGTWSAFLLVWQNLKRMGKQAEAKKFALWGSVLIFVYQVILVMIASYGKATGDLSQILLIAFPLWLEFKYFRKWRAENLDNKVKFHFSAVLWGLLGLVATVAMWYATIVIAVQFGF